MSLTQLFMQALQLEYSWPLLLLSMMAYPFLLAIRAVARILTIIFLYPYEIIYKRKIQAHSSYGKRAINGDVSSIDDARTICRNINNAIQLNSALRDKFFKFKSILSETIIQKEILLLRDEELEFRAYSYAATLFDASSPDIMNAAVNFETYINRLHNQKLSPAFFWRLIEYGGSLDQELVRYNTMVAVKDMLKRDDIEKIKSHFTRIDSLSMGARKLVECL